MIGSSLPHRQTGAVDVLGDDGESHQKTVKALLDGRADPSIGDARGVTPLQHAQQRGYREIVEMLIAAGAR